MYFSRSFWKTTLFLGLTFTQGLHSQGEEDAFDLFTQACVQCGSNPNLIQSGRVTLEVKKTDDSPNRVERSIQSFTQSLQNHFQGTPQELEDMLAEQIPAIRAALEQNSTQEQLNLVFRGNNLYFQTDTKQTYRLFENRIYDPSSKKWREDSRTICYGNPNIPNSSRRICLSDGANTVMMGKEFFNYGEFQTFGRMRGSTTWTVLGILLPKSQRQDFLLTQEGKAALKQYMLENNWSLQVSGMETYDKNSSAVVVEMLYDQQIIGRYWIDESRGFICPLVQIFDDSGRLIEEYNSSDYFLHKDSGLWFPTIDIQTVKQIQETSNIRSEYRIYPETLQLNVKISDREFSIDVREGSRVIDASNEGEPIKYLAVTNGVVSLAKGGYDFSNMKWLVREEGVQNYIPPKGGFSGWIRWVFILGGTALILAMLFVKWKKRKLLTHFTMLIFLTVAPILLSGIGCSKNPIEQSISEINPLSVSPEVIDFGTVRPTDSPVKSVFELCNTGNQNIVITDIKSGCGCTLIDIPQEPILPGEKVPVTVRVDLFGRFGDFKNRLQIQTANGSLLEVEIRGEIASDIWASGQSLRCSVGPEETIASTILTLYTANYPEIIFEDAKQDEGVAFKEISRITKEGETSIRFSLEIEVGTDDIVAKNIKIIPKDGVVAPLIIPLYCYRSDET